MKTQLKTNILFILMLFLVMISFTTEDLLFSNISASMSIIAGACYINNATQIKNSSEDRYKTTESNNFNRT